YSVGTLMPNAPSFANSSITVCGISPVRSISSASTFSRSNVSNFFKNSSPRLRSSSLCIGNGEISARLNSPMNRPLTNVFPCAVVRAASVNSIAARWPADIFDVSIVCGSSIAIKFSPAGGHLFQQVARLEIFRAAVDEIFHRADDAVRSQRIRITQRSAAERREAGAHDHCKIDVR